MCRCLAVSRAGYYAWLGRPESERVRRDRELLPAIRKAHHDGRRNYGSPRVHRELRFTGIAVGRHRVARLMRANGIRGCRKRRFVATTNSNHDLPVAPNLLARKFTQNKPNVAWAADITYIATAEGWLYLAVLLDLYSRRIVGWAMDSRIDRHLAVSALQMALANRPAVAVLHHSDRGVQYASEDYRAALTAAGMRQSMSRTGDCWDNAVAESFFGTLKTELVDGTVYPTRDAAKTAVFEWIEVFYNRRRRHSSLGYLAPVEYEEAATVV
jgi:transposase InsO family protein